MAAFGAPRYNEYGQDGLESIPYYGKSMSLRAIAAHTETADLITPDGDSMSLIGEAIGVG
jgi:hypothetical protein